MSKLARALESGEFILTCELNPPKGTDLSDLFAKADRLKDRMHGMNLTDSHAARMSMCPLAAARLLLDRGAEPILQLTTRDRNRIALQGDLIGASALGVSNVVFMGGDPPTNGDHPDAKPVFDVSSAQLLDAVTNLNQGRDMAGESLKGATELVVGAVVNPGADKLDVELRRMEEKLKAGARFFQSQAVYDVGAYERFARAVEAFGTTVLAGIIPLKSAGQARWMTEHVPGIEVPDALVAEIDAASDRVATSSARSAKIISDVRPMCQGIHVMAIGWEQHIPGILAQAGL